MSYFQAYLLRRDVERDRPEVDTPVRVYARDDAEDAGPFRASLPQTAEAKDDRPLVLCHNLKVKGLSTQYLMSAWKHWNRRRFDITVSCRECRFISLAQPE